MQIAGISSPIFERGLNQVHYLNAIANLHTSNQDALKFLSPAAIVLLSFTSLSGITLLLHSSLQHFSLFLHGNTLPGLSPKGTVSQDRTCTQSPSQWCQRSTTVRSVSISRPWYIAKSTRYTVRKGSLWIQFFLPSHVREWTIGTFLSQSCKKFPTFCVQLKFC